MVLVFAGTSILKEPSFLQEVKESYPRAHILGCSTAGEICGTTVSDNSLVATAVRFEHTQIRVARVHVGGSENSFQ
ncbi:MAG TPA: FIST N-terminal domain-containing protein, partial [Candidatus Bathyarchaeia archaeon]|nr:FIST N-terminal domain-containing protein [Candidatus Bathyarchaeia archaeon]